GAVVARRTPSLRAQRSNPVCHHRESLDCFAALAMTMWTPRIRTPLPAGGARRSKGHEAMTAMLEMRNVSKSFAGVQALRDVNFSVEAGQIHALVGENGAGKSTLMKVLSGVYPHGSYEGTIVFDGEERRFRDINDSEELGIIIIHQELALIPLMSIAENIFLSHPPSKLGVIDRTSAYRRTRELLAQVGLKESPDTLITDLGVGKQQLVEIA